MNINPFLVEEWMNAHEVGARYNIAEPCVDSISLEELWALTGEDGRAFWQEFCSRRLTYGDIEGLPALREGICGLYRSLSPECIIPTHGAAGANHHIFYSLIEPGDRVVSIMPTDQQLYSIPEGYGADVQILKLKEQPEPLRPCYRDKWVAGKTDVTLQAPLLPQSVKLLFLCHLSLCLPLCL